MVDWTKSMTQTFEYYIVDPGTWKDRNKIENIKSSSIKRDANTETLSSLTMDVNGTLDENYVRVYLITVQNGVREKHPLGTFLVQTPVTSFDGKTHDIKIDAYSPLLELKENQPPIGYSLLEGEEIMNRAFMVVRENVRAPIVKVDDNEKLFDDFVANTDDNWVTFIRDLISNAKYNLDLDDMGRIIFSKSQDISALQPVWTFDDSNSSILYPSLEINQDLYGIPNAVEVIYSNNRNYFYKKVVNDDPNSPTSTIRRGREIVYRDINPGGIGNPTEDQLERYAKQLLKNLSCLEYKITYTHGYCPVRLGDCVRLNYERAGIINVKAKIVSQNIDCTPGCPVTETAVFTNRLWG